MMEQREKLIELMQSFQNEYPKSFDSLYYELAAEADHLLENGVVVLPCKIVDAVLTAIKCAVEQMPSAKDNFCSSCKWREWAATHFGEIKDE